MIKALIDIYYVWINELKLVFRDSAVVMMFLIIPLGYPLLYTYIYNNEVERDVKVVVADESHSALAREFARYIDASPDVAVIGYKDNLEEAKECMRRKEAYGILYLPREFSKNLNTKRQANVILYADMSSMLNYKNIALCVSDVSLKMGADIRLKDMGYKSKGDDTVTKNAVLSEWIAYYNPSNGFAGFLIPAVLILIIQQTMLLGVGTLVGTHNDKKRYSIASHAYSGKKVGAFKLTLGKAFCYASFYIVISSWIIRVVPYLFSLPQIGDPLTIAVFLMPYILAATFFCMTLSYFCSQREFAMPLFVFTSVSFLFLSGTSWPWTSIPDALKAIAYLIPSTPAVRGFVRINTMGATLDEVWFEYIALWIQAAAYWIAATLMYKWWIANYDPKYKGNLPVEITDTLENN